MKRPLTLLLTALILFSAAACGGQTVSPASRENEKTSEEKVTFTARDLDGNLVDQSVLSGKKVTMLNVWGTYCGPCKQEMPDLAALAGAFGDSFQIIGVCIDAADRNFNALPEIKEKAKSILESAGAAYLQLLPSASLAEWYLGNVQYIPTTYFLDENGRVIGDEYLGSRTGPQWRSIIESVLEEVG